MISILTCALALFAGQAPSVPPVPAEITYRVKLYDHSGLLSAPKVRTLDGQEASISQKSDKREFKVMVLPHASTRGDRIDTELNLSLSGSPSVSTILKERSGATSYIKISKALSRGGKTVGATISISAQRPRLGRDDFLAVIIGTIQQPPEDDPFTAPRRALQQGAAPPSQILYHVVMRGSKGVVASPVVRTLDNYVARINPSGALGSVSIGLLPRTQTNGELLTMLDFNLDGDEVARIAVHNKPGEKQLYKVWKEDAATAHVEPLASSRRAHLKSGEWLLEVTGTVVTDRP